MLEQHLKSPVTRQRLRSGPAADHIDGFADWLHRHRYSPITIDTTLRSLAGWTDWMRAAGFTEHDMLAGFASCSAELQTHRRVRYGRGPNDHSLAALPCSSGFSGNKGCCRRLLRRRLQPISGLSSESFVHGCACTVD